MLACVMAVSIVFVDLAPASDRVTVCFPSSDQNNNFVFLQSSIRAAVEHTEPT